MFTRLKLFTTNSFKRILFVSLAVFLSLQGTSQLNFSVSNLTGLHQECVNPTTLQFGPDGKLYVGTEGGRLFIYTISKTGSNSYSVTSTQVIYLVAQIPNHNDNGQLYNGIFETRQVTGLLVTGTASNPVIYVSSSDPRVGGGGTGGDLNLDTNSGVVSKLTWNGSSWEKVDIVRGLPRSEENHAVNGLQIDNSTNSLYLAVGGITNAGAPSNNFAFLTEYALSAAILKIDLNMINNLPVRGSGNNKYVYDLPTLNDPSRTDIANSDYNASLPGSQQTIDQNDPFGGNDGVNQAKLVPGGPVQIYSPGYRNSYDLVLTKAAGKAGRMYTIDNGANDGWGGYPKNVGSGSVTNEYDAAEPGSTSGSGNLAVVNNLDNLHLVSKPGMNPIYGGHPNPIRANPGGAGLFTHNGTSGTFSTNIPPLPSDWPPVPLGSANPVEGNFYMPGVDDGALTTFPASTNGIAEYWSSNYFNGQLTGDLLAADFSGNIWRLKLNADGTQLVSKEIFASGFAEITLDITTQGNGEVFDGTVWVCDYTGSKISIFTPETSGSINCTGDNTNTTLDDDSDGYDNADETLNGTNPCNPVSVPADFDGDKTSDKLDADDDNDGIPDVTDVFHKDAENGQATATTLQYPFLNNNPGTGLFGLGFTGLMSNGASDPDQLFDLTDPGLVMGGAVGLASFPADQGTAVQNTQRNGFQFGYKTSSASPSFEVQTALVGPFFNNLTAAQLNQNYIQGMYIGTGDQNNYVMIALSGATGGGTPGIRVLVENNGAVTKNTLYPVSNILQAASVYLSVFINPVTGKLTLKHSSNLNATWQTVETDLQAAGLLLTKLNGPGAVALGLIGSSGTSTTFSARFDYMHILAPAPLIINPTEDFGVNINTANKLLNLTNTFSDDEGVANITLSVAGNTNTALVTSAIISGKNLTLTFASGQTGTALIKVRATDSDGYWVEDEFEVDVVSPPPASALLINSGGPALVMGGWIADQHFTSGETYADFIPISGTMNDVMYQDERWGNFNYKIPLANGKYTVKLHFAEIYWTSAGQRIFNVDVEGGQGSLNNYDIYNEAGGVNAAVVEEFQNIDVTDGFLDLVFTSLIDNAKISGIEIIPVATPLKAPVVTSPIADMVVNMNSADKTIDLSNVYSDDKPLSGLTHALVSNSNTVLVSAVTITGSILKLSFAADKTGEAIITIKATDADNLSVQESFKVTVVTPPVTNKAPVVTVPVADVVVNKNASDKTINLSNVYTDDKPVSELTHTVISNSNPALINSIAITGASLKLSFAQGKDGEATIRIRATDAGGLFVDEYFKVTVVATKAPVLVSPIPDVVVSLYAPDKMIDLSKVYSDDKPVSQLIHTLVSNTNPSVIKVTITGSVLKLFFPTKKYGEAIVRIRATDADGLYADEYFKVTVLAPKPPILVSPVPDMVVNMNSADKTIDLSKVYSDDKPVSLLKHTVSGNTDHALVKTTITGSILKLSFGKNKSGEATIRIRATDTDGMYADEYFKVTVVAPNAAPTVSRAIPDQLMIVNGTLGLNISEVFADDRGAGNLKFLLLSNSNSGLITAKLNGNTLNLSSAFNALGNSVIKIQATDEDGQKATDEFKVTVGYNSIRINSGGREIVLDGQTWLPDSFYDDGDSETEKKNIENTGNDVLYQTYREGEFSYSIPVPNGTYLVKLHFAELKEKSAGKRIFNVYVEKNQGILKNYDVFVKAGGHSKMVIAALNNISVTDGKLNIDFDEVEDDAIVSGIEIVPLNITNKAPWVSKTISDQWYNMDASDKEIKLNDHFEDDQKDEGLVYSIRSNSNPSLIKLKLEGNTGSSGVWGNDDDDDDDDDDDEDKNGNNTLEMDFSRHKTGYSIIRLRATDLLGLCGEEEFRVDIGLVNPAIARTLRINSGGQAINYGSEIWANDQYYSGGTSYTGGLPVVGTLNDKMYQQIRYGKNFSYSIPVVNGIYLVKLHFIETQHLLGGQRLFNVSVENGQGKLTNYDLIAKWKLRFQAGYEQFTGVKVADGTLNISFTGIKDNALISGIEIIPTTNGRLGLTSLFDARVADTTVGLQWTVQDDETVTVQIERSANGADFESIGQANSEAIKAAKSGGFTDRAPLPGISYYRLRFTSPAGLTAYSDTRSVTIKPAMYGLMLYPNPNTTGVVYAELARQDKELLKVRLMDVTGRTVQSQPTVERTSHMLLKIKLPNGIAKGIYFLEIQSNGKLYNSRLVVQ